jgi:dTDP-4-amino-4,6-dideoxygalactose transaminase
VYFGNEVNWEKINKILNKYNLKLNEDGYVVDLEK